MNTVTAPAEAAPVRSVTLSDGAVITSQMTPTERHNAVAKSVGAPAVEHPTVNLFPVTGMTDGTAAEFARRDAKAPPRSDPSVPPRPVAPSATVNDPGKLEAFDAEMRAKGLQLDTAVRSVADGEIDAEGLNTLHHAYRALSPAEREQKREQYQAELAEFYDGRRRNESRAQFQARRAGSAPIAEAPAPASNDAGLNAALDVATKASSKYGFAPASAITGPLLHGYTIPQNREYNVAELVAGLRLARAGNLTQSQVDAIIGKSNV